MGSSRRDLLNYMAEHTSILKNSHNTHYSLTFQDRPLCSASSMESSRRDLLNYMAEHMSILKNSHNTHYSLTFQDRPISLINGKLSPRPFELYG